jgi:hypothetical protein
MAGQSDDYLHARLIPEGAGPRNEVPLSIAFVDRSDLRRLRISAAQAIRAVAAEVNGPVGVNVFDLDAVTTTSDGVMVRGAIIAMGAGDHGKVHPEFGMLEIPAVAWDAEIAQAEPHLAQWNALYPGRQLFRGPDPARKLIPVHNAVMTGRAVNNNSATEMMNVVTMEEILLPILGQLELMRDHPVLIGPTGEAISVGIGMTVAERWGRVFPTRQFPAGTTAHRSGAYAKTLKRHIPCILSPKRTLARRILQALRAGMVPGRDLGCSPAVLALARAAGSPIAWDAITAEACEELASVGSDREHLEGISEMDEEQIIAEADRIIPGAEDTVEVPASALLRLVKVKICTETRT